MSHFLDKVTAQRALDVARRKKETPVGPLLDRAGDQPIRNFRASITGGGRIIAEVKRRSPSVVAFRSHGTPAELAAIYAANGAAAISIVTDEANFGTSLADITGIRAAVQLPVLAKDFVIDEYQVIEARAAGADALLLIARILTAERLAALLQNVRELGMTALVECHTEEDVQHAAAAGAQVIGVNNRDLSTLTTSFEPSRRCLPLIPAGAVRVSESGINHRADVEVLGELGVDAFLIGGALLNAADPGKKLRELLGQEEETAS